MHVHHQEICALESRRNQRITKFGSANQARQESDPFDARALLIPRRLNVKARVRVTFQVQHATHAEANASRGARDGMLESAKEGHDRVGIATLEVVLVPALNAVEFIGLVVDSGHGCDSP